MNVVYDSRSLLCSATLTTLQLFFAAGALAVVMSLLAGLLRLSPWKPVRWIIASYVEVFRGTSVVVQLFWLYFALPAFGISLEAFPAAVVALGLCFGAYGSEVVRGAVLGVPKGQYEAAVALNMSTFDQLRCVILPQAFVSMLPPYTNNLILLLKSTAAASFITIPELTFRATSLNQVTYATVPIFATVLTIYFIIALALSAVLRRLERKVGAWRVPRT